MTTGSAEYSAISITTTTNEFALLGAGTVYGRITAGVAAVEVKVGANKLVGRKAVIIQADPANGGTIYFGYDNTVSATNYAFALSGGGGATIKFNTTDALALWCLASQATQYFGCTEEKSS